MEFKDYYQILGIKKGATAEEIKEAYRKLARQYHPDLHQENKKHYEEKFKEINEAYEVLSDPEKRSRYDQLGANWENVSRQATWTRTGFEDLFSAEGPGGGFSDFFKAFFGDFYRPGERREGFRTFRREEPGFRFHFRSEAPPFEDLFTDASQADFRNFRTEAEERKAQTQPIEITLEEAYSGAKKMVAVEERGKRHRLQVKIPPGVQEGSRIRIPKKKGVLSADVYLEVKLKPHPVFQREGDDLTCEVPVGVYEAILGGTVTLATLDGKKIALNLSPETQNGQVFRVRGAGMPRLSEKGKGDLFVKIKVVLPTNLTPREKELYQELAKIRSPKERKAQTVS